jgi:N-dimethylarginine dimethylaminohydrolase
VTVGAADSECSTRPTAILVHDPVAAGSFARIESIDDDARLESEVLFRSRPDAARYARQHERLVRTIREQVDRVFYLSDLIGSEEAFRPAAANPNQVFTRDSLITLPWAPDGYFRARMRPPQRRQEASTMEAAVRRLGLREIASVPGDVFLEGGDVIPFAHSGQRCLLVGCGPRSTLDAADWLAQALVPAWADRVVALELAAWRMNLDGGFVPVAEDVVVSDAESIVRAWEIDGHGRVSLDVWALLGDLGVRTIETTPEESVYRQSCNCLCLGDRRVIYYDLCPRVARELRRHELRVSLVPGSELIKGRGGPRCMTRPLYLEALPPAGLARAGGCAALGPAPSGRRPKSVCRAKWNTVFRYASVSGTAMPAPRSASAALRLSNTSLRLR